MKRLLPCLAALLLSAPAFATPKEDFDALLQKHKDLEKFGRSSAYCYNDAELKDNQRKLSAQPADEALINTEIALSQRYIDQSIKLLKLMNELRVIDTKSMPKDNGWPSNDYYLTLEDNSLCSVYAVMVQVSDYEHSAIKLQASGSCVSSDGLRKWELVPISGDDCF